MSNLETIASAVHRAATYNLALDENPLECATKRLTDYYDSNLKLVRDVKKLRTAEPMKAPLSVRIKQLLDSVSSWFFPIVAIFARNSDDYRNRLCRFNGHRATFLNGVADGRCQDCGEPITDLRSLRINKTQLQQSAASCWTDLSLSNYWTDPSMERVQESEADNSTGYSQLKKLRLNQIGY